MTIIIKASLKTRNISLLMNAIIRHNSVIQNTKILNLSLKNIIFILYYCLRPILNIMLFIFHSPETNFYTRIIFATIIFIGFFILYVVNHLCASVSSVAHNSYPMVYSFLIRNNTKIAIKRKLKILAFIEKLSGPEIGIYCWDLFPMNNYEFFYFNASWAANYILIIGFL